MRRVKRFAVCLVCLILIGGILSPSYGGVEPSPFHDARNRLNAILNGVDAIEGRLDRIYQTVTSGPRPNTHGLVNRLDTISDHLDAYNQTIAEYPWELPGEMDYMPIQLHYFVSQGTDKAESIISICHAIMAECNEWAPEVIPILESVQLSAQSFIDLLNSLLRVE